MPEDKINVGDANLRIVVDTKPLEEFLNNLETAVRNCRETICGPTKVQQVGPTEIKNG